jgi:hypothetical protein
MLIYVQQGWMVDAETVYNTLQNKFPENQAGHAHSEMAAVFWSAYQDSQDIGNACEQAIQYAVANPEAILAYLGNGEYSKAFYGSYSLDYKPEDVCPFK